MTTPSQRRQLFISYSHADREWVDRLRTVLRPVERSDGLDLWDDSRIEAGAQWMEEIQRALASARVALLLVSPEFLASDFVAGKELPPLFEAARQAGLRILWVPLRHSLVGRTPIHAFQAVIRPGLPLAAMAEAERDEALVRIAETILDALERSDSGGTDQPGPTDSTPPKSSTTSAPPQPPTISSPPPHPAEEPPASKEQGVLALRMISCATARIGAQGKDQQGEERWGIQPRTVTLTVFEEALGDGVPLELVETPAGTFTMGSPSGEEGRDVYAAAWPDDLRKALAVEGVDVEAQRRISVPAFLMGRQPITQAQWRLVAGWPRQERELDPEPSHFLGDQRPVEQVSWYDAVEFCHRLSLRTGRPYALPSEAKWEYACRAGGTKPFHFGATLSPELANYAASVAYGTGPKGEFRQQTSDVGSFPANAWGLHDMHGNVGEWCLDRWHPSPAKGPTDGSAWQDPAVEVPKEYQDCRLLRGGSWDVIPRSCRSASRIGIRPDSRDFSVGFRVCCLPPGLPSQPSGP